jgi:hypothetical protein
MISFLLSRTQHATINVFVFNQIPFAFLTLTGRIGVHLFCYYRYFILITDKNSRVLKKR